MFNAGTIIALNGVFAGDGSDFTNTGTVLSSHVGLYRANETGITPSLASTLTNAAGALISGTSAGIIVDAAGVILHNAGLVEGATAAIMGYAASAPGANTASYLYNNGVMQGATAGLVLGANAYAYNYGTITGGVVGVAGKAAGSFGTALYNYGTIIGNTGVSMAGGLVVNDGVIEATGHPKGNPFGFGTGVSITGGGTLDGTGTILGSVYFGHDRNNLLVLRPDAVIAGQVDLGGGVLELTGGGDGKLLAGQYGDVSHIAVNPGAVWELFGDETFAATIEVTNNGTLTGSTAAFDGAVLGTGQIDILAGQMDFGGVVDRGETVNFSGAGEVLTLGDSKEFSGAIGHLRIGDTIDLADVTAAAVRRLDFHDGTLTVEEAHRALTFTFASAAALRGAAFGYFADGTGTGITLSAAGTMGFLAGATSGAAASALPAYSAPAGVAAPDAAALSLASAHAGWAPASLWREERPNLLGLTLQS